MNVCVESEAVEGGGMLRRCLRSIFTDPGAVDGHVKKRSKLIIDREEGNPRCERGREEKGGEGRGGGKESWWCV